VLAVAVDDDDDTTSLVLLRPVEAAVLMDDEEKEVVDAVNEDVEEEDDEDEDADDDDDNDNEDEDETAVEEEEDEEKGIHEHWGIFVAIATRFSASNFDVEGTIEKLCEATISDQLHRMFMVLSITMTCVSIGGFHESNTWRGPHTAAEPRTEIAALVVFGGKRSIPY
jgi:hypothetical protein